MNTYRILPGVDGTNTYDTRNTYTHLQEVFLTQKEVGLVLEGYPCTTSF